MRLPWSAILLVAAGACSAAPARPTRPESPITFEGSAPKAPEPTVKTPVSPWSPLYPETRAADTNDTLFGTRVPDPYRWLEDGKSGEVQEWMKRQDELTRAKLAALPERASIAARM